VSDDRADAAVPLDPDELAALVALYPPGMVDPDKACRVGTRVYPLGIWADDDPRRQVTYTASGDGDYGRLNPRRRH
jgi:hypothetical protein